MLLFFLRIRAKIHDPLEPRRIFAEHTRQNVKLSSAKFFCILHTALVYSKRVSSILL